MDFPFRKLVSFCLSLCHFVCLSVCLCLSHLFHYVPIMVSSWKFQEWLPMAEVMSMQKFKVRGQTSRLLRWKPKLAVSGPYLHFDFTYGDEMMHKAWYCLGAVPYWFSRSSVKFQVHMAKKNRRFRPKLGVSGRYLQFELTDGYEMMHKDWTSIEDVQYCFFKVIRQISRSHG